MATDSYLRLLPAPLAQAILASTSSQRLVFAVECAKLAVEHCTRAVLGHDAEVEVMLASLRDRTMRAVDTGETGDVDRALAWQESALYQRMTALRRDDSAADYTAFVRIATQRHAIRALRAALVVDGLSAAARAAYETIAAMKFDDGVMRIAGAALAHADPR